MSRLQAFRDFRAALREGRLGDAALLKADAVGGGSVDREVAERLRELGPFPDIDPEPLRQLPRGTLGREYIELLDANGLSPFRLSDRIDPAVIERQIFVARYSLVHDVFHILTGFDTSWAGELGVWSFVASQRYARAHWIAVALACVIYPFLAITQVPRMWKNLRRGIAMGRRARPLLFIPFEHLWSRSVADLRRELDVDAASELRGLVSEPPSAVA